MIYNEIWSSMLQFYKLAPVPPCWLVKQILKSSIPVNFFAYVRHLLLRSKASALRLILLYVVIVSLVFDI